MFVSPVHGTPAGGTTVIGVKDFDSDLQFLENNDATLDAWIREQSGPTRDYVSAPAIKPTFDRIYDDALNFAKGLFS
ncbi:MAG: hypothetical protein AAF203_10650, partial [Pseudomonadota bacterium]